jgi:hypothetical protein
LVLVGSEGWFEGESTGKSPRVADGYHPKGQAGENKRE